MKWVDRGPEPGGVVDYARRFTQGWIDYFEKRVGARPEDSDWREFRPLLGACTNNNCWYCERACYIDSGSPERAPAVDHFRPRRWFPALVYAWPNWVYSCQRCNDSKGDGWPEHGYVDPCAAVAAERPERYFDYDRLTGEIVPRGGLAGEARQRALRTIDDLGLNAVDVRFYRHHHTRQFEEDIERLPIGDRQDFSAMFTDQSVEYAGVTRMVMEQLPDLLRQS